MFVYARVPVCVYTFAANERACVLAGVWVKSLMNMPWLVPEGSGDRLTPTDGGLEFLNHFGSL